LLKLFFQPSCPLYPTLVSTFIGLQRKYVSFAALQNA